MGHSLAGRLSKPPNSYTLASSAMFFGGGGGGFPFGGMPGMEGMEERGPSKPVDNTGFYELLGVAKDADDATLKKTYRKLAMKHHPDRGGDPAKFQEIQQAYDVLSDADKRKVYDRYGKEGIDEGRGDGGGGGGGGDIFQQMFGGGGGRGRREQGPPKGEDVMHRLGVSLTDLYKGKTVKLKMTRKVLCPDCGGNGCRKGSKPSVCADCKGRGVRVVVRQLGPGMITQQQMVCDSCGGNGEMISARDKCGRCNGRKLTSEQTQLEVQIDPGMKNNQKIKLTEMGDQEPGKVAGDVVFVLTQKENDTFQRKGNDLLLKKDIQLVDALCGNPFTITHLDGRVIKVLPQGMIKPGALKSIEQEGMPTWKRPFEKGTLVIQFKIIFPEDGALSESAFDQLRQILPADPNKPMLTGDEEEANLNDFDLEQFGAEAAAGKSAYDDDDEGDGEGGGQQVRCAQS